MTLAMNTTAFLIDADNLSPAAVEEAFAKLANFPGSLTVRRAYGGAEKLAGLREVLHRHAVRAFVNHGKGTTDVALTVDAIDLLHQVGPAVIAIGSGDGDFVPLVVRLREAGVRVLCFAQAGKAADDIAYAYDAVIHVGGRGQGAPSPAPTVQAVTVQPSPAAGGTPAASDAPRGDRAASASRSVQQARASAPPSSRTASEDAPAPQADRSATEPASRSAPAPGASRPAGERGRNRKNGARTDRRSDQGAESRSESRAGARSEPRADGRGSHRSENRGDARSDARGDTRIDTPPEARSIFPVARAPETESRAPVPSPSETRAEGPAAAPAPGPAPATPTPAPAPAPVPVSAAPAPAPAAAEGEAVEQVRRLLAAVPDWKTGVTKQLNALGTPLQEAGLRKGGKPLHELFRKFPAYFEVLPRTGQARQVRLLQQP
jgi:hypothetical protein